MALPMIPRQSSLTRYSRLGQGGIGSIGLLICPPRLAVAQREQLGDILHSGPVAYGLDSGLWASPMITRLIEEEFAVRYHPGQLRKPAWRTGLLGAATVPPAGPRRRQRAGPPAIRLFLTVSARKSAAANPGELVCLGTSSHRRSSAAPPPCRRPEDKGPAQR